MDLGREEWSQRSTCLFPDERLPTSTSTVRAQQEPSGSMVMSGEGESPYVDTTSPTHKFNFSSFCRPWFFSLGGGVCSPFRDEEEGVRRGTWVVGSHRVIRWTGGRDSSLDSPSSCTTEVRHGPVDGDGCHCVPSSVLRP